MRALVLGFVILAVVVPRTAIAQFADPILGGWEWESTTIDGVVETPESVGYTMQYLLGPEWQWIVYRDRQVYFEGTFSEGSFWACSGSSIHFLAFEGDGTMWYYGIGGGDPPLLYLQDGFNCPLGEPTPIRSTMVFSYVGTVDGEESNWGSLKANYR